MYKVIKKFIFRSVLSLILLSFVHTGCLYNKAAFPVAEKGLIDLKKWNPDSNECLPLNGEWIFHWNKHLVPAKIIYPDNNFKFQKQPELWNKQFSENRNLSAHGKATYSLFLKGLTQGKIYCLKIPYIYSSYKFFFNSKIVAKNGKPGNGKTDTVPCFKNSYAYVKAGEKNSIVIHVSNFHDRKSGMWDSIMIGTPEKILQDKNSNLFIEVFLFGCMIIMSLYHFVLFILRIENRPSLYFSIFSFALSLRYLLTGEILVTQFFPDFPWMIQNRIEYLTVFIAWPFFVKFTSSLYPDESSRYPDKIILLISALFSIVTLFTEKIIFSYLIVAYYPLIIISMIYLWIVVSRAIMSSRPGSILAGASLLIFFITVMLDILRAEEIINIIPMAPIGFFSFILLQSFIVSIRYAATHRQVKILSKKLETKDIIKNDFLSNTSHELKTPLTGIIGISESILDSFTDNLSPNIIENIKMIHASGRRLNSVVNDMLDFSKLTNRDIILSMKDVDLKSAVDIAIELLKPAVKNTELRLINSINSSFPMVSADENRLQQILLQLIGNAIKFTEDGEIIIIARSISTPVPGHIEISVYDTGTGIPFEKQSEIFNAFEQIDSSDKRSRNGMGIGLSITKELVSLHGGKIFVNSTPDQGSVFTFTLQPGSGKNREISPPITKHKNGINIINENQFKNTALLHSCPDPEINKGTVIIVDDDIINLNILENQLLFEGYAVLKATNGIDALKIIEKTPALSLIILDIMMPKMSGYDVTKKIRKKYSQLKLPVLILTAKASPEDVNAGFEAGANDYLVKPFSKIELLARVKTLIGVKNAARNEERLTTFERDINIARMILDYIVADEIPDIDGLDIAVKYVSADSIGGDFYSFCISDNCTGILIADVTGHGVSSALAASMIKVAFNILKINAKDPAELLRGLNRIMFESLKGQFITAAYVCMDTDENRILFARAGHEPLIIFNRETKILNEYIPRGPLIGLAEDINIELCEIKLQHGDRLILYTDGIIEAMNSERKMFGARTFHELISGNSQMDAADLKDHIYDRVTSWSGPGKGLEDDFTLIITDYIK